MVCHSCGAFSVLTHCQTITALRHTLFDRPTTSFFCCEYILVSSSHGSHNGQPSYAEPHVRRRRTPHRITVELTHISAPAVIEAATDYLGACQTGRMGFLASARDWLGSSLQSPG